jgi:hypothetical protein
MFTTFVVAWAIASSGIIMATVFDLVCAALIVGKLLVRRKKVKHIASRVGNQYGTLASIFIESSMINAITRIIYAAAGGNNPNGNVTWAGLLAASGAVSLCWLPCQLLLLMTTTELRPDTDNRPDAAIRHVQPQSAKT